MRTTTSSWSILCVRRASPPSCDRRSMSKFFTFTHLTRRSRLSASHGLRLSSSLSSCLVSLSVPTCTSSSMTRCMPGWATRRYLCSFPSLCIPFDVCLNVVTAWRSRASSMTSSIILHCSAVITKAAVSFPRRARTSRPCRKV